MITGKLPSGPTAGTGGKATRTSIGTLSKLLTVLRAVPPGFPAIVWSQRRFPPDCTAHGIGAAVFENTLVMVAPAGAAARSVTNVAQTATSKVVTARGQLRPDKDMLPLPRLTPRRILSAYRVCRTRKGAGFRQPPFGLPSELRATE